MSLSRMGVAVVGAAVVVLGGGVAAVAATDPVPSVSTEDATGPTSTDPAPTESADQGGDSQDQGDTSTTDGAAEDSGTSADAQLAVFEAHTESKGREAALRAVTDWIAAATLQ